MNIHKSILVFMDAASIYVSNLRFEIEEAGDFLHSKAYTEEEYKKVTSRASEKIAEIEEASSVLLDFVQILNRRSRAAENLEEAESHLKSILDISL